MSSKKSQAEVEQNDVKTKITQWLGYYIFLFFWFAFADASCGGFACNEEAPRIFVYVMPLLFSLVSLLVLGVALMGVKDMKKVHPLSETLNREIVSKELNRDLKFGKDLLVMFIFYVIEGAATYFITYKLTQSQLALPMIGSYGLFFFGIFSLVNFRKTVKPMDIAFRTDTFIGTKTRYEEESNYSIDYLLFKNTSAISQDNLNGKPTCYYTLVSNTGNPLSEGDTVFVVYKVKSNDVLRIYPANEFHF